MLLVWALSTRIPTVTVPEKTVPPGRADLVRRIVDALPRRRTFAAYLRGCADGLELREPGGDGGEGTAAEANDPCGIGTSVGLSPDGWSRRGSRVGASAATALRDTARRAVTSTHDPDSKCLTRSRRVLRLIVRRAVRPRTSGREPSSP